MQPFGRNLTNNVRRKMAVVLRNGRHEGVVLLLVGNGKEDKGVSIF